MTDLDAGSFPHGRRQGATSKLVKFQMRPDPLAD